MATDNPYQSPEAGIENTVDTGQPGMFALRGRIGRVRYFCYYWMMSMLTLIVLSVLLIGAELLLGMRDVNATGLGAVVGITFLISNVLILLVLSSRRWNDIGKSAKYNGLLFVPLINVGILIGLLLMPGDKGENPFGAEPDKNSPMIWLAFCFGLLLMVLFVFMFDNLAVT